MAIETPGSRGAFGPTLEVAATTFPRAPRLIMIEAARTDAEPSTVIVRYKLSEVSECFSTCARIFSNWYSNEAAIADTSFLSFFDKAGRKSGERQ